MKKVLMYVILFVALLGMLQLRSKIDNLPQQTFQTFNLADKVEQVIPSVVHIRHSSGWSGSGVIISPDGLVLTASHVIGEGGEYTITLNDGRVFKSKEACVSKKYDVGFIKIVAENLPISYLGNSDILRIGEQLFAIGSPFGDINFNSVTLGILSAKNRTTDEISGWTVLFQTDAAANPGNSGCPIYSMQGKIVGIVVGGFNPSVVYFIPIECAEDLFESVQLIFALEKIEYIEATEKWEE